MEVRGIRYMLEAIYGAVDSGEADSRIFFAESQALVKFPNAWTRHTNGRAGYTGISYCAPNLDRCILEQPTLVGNNNWMDFISLENSKRRSPQRIKLRIIPLFVMTKNLPFEKAIRG